MARTAVKIHLDTHEKELLQKIQRKRSVAEYMKERLQIVLAAADGLQNKDITAQYGLEVNRVGIWRKRWVEHHQQWQQTDEHLRPAMNETLVLLWLSDKKGRGRKEDFTAEQRTKIVALSRETPEQNGLPVTHWSAERLAKVAAIRGIVVTISRPTVSRILKKTTCLPTAVDTGSMPR